MSSKVLVAMSGGVDSSVAAYLLKSAGHELIGAMMKLYSTEDIHENSTHRGCCSLSDAEDARAVATSMDIPFFVFNFTDTFGAEVIERFVKAYEQGLTPNPCIDCNRFMKFKRLLHRSTELECDYISTGHYARISRENGRFLLKTGLDATKDQSYVLYAMTQPQLSRTLLPLGELTKEAVREIAAEQGFINARKKDSQDICFAPDGDYAGFIERYTFCPTKKGRFINKDGQTLGEHRGIINYTIGQRKGLGLFHPEPLYVLNLNAKDNTVTVGASDDLFATTLHACDINLIPMDKLDGPMRVQAKIRYSHPPAPATLWQLDDDTIRVEFDTPQRAITPGQAIVLYDGEIVIGGGTIEGAINRSPKSKSDRNTYTIYDDSCDRCNING
ncbi:MAG: tRNA 2-thiouridine(34) synthase MnmA [Defluviitaleaceae bacterium]|nr:tRNA 2-thiouridine(34) synthase MnmA [Defluviitaleaceae bacterium]